MRKLLLILFLTASIGLWWRPTDAQLNKAYFFYVGRSFLIDNKYQDAIEVLNILLRADSTAYEGYFLRGIAKYNLDDLLGAEQDFTLAIRQNPVFTIALQYRAITRSRLGNYDDALRDFQEAIDLRPDLPSAYYSRGVTYLLTQQFEKAVEDFSTYIHYDNKVADAFLNRGTCYLYLKDTVRALADFDRGVRTNYFDPNGYNRRGALYMTQKKYDLALSDFNQAIHYDSTFIPAYFNRALVYYSLKQPVQAIENFSRVIELDSTSAQTLFNRALLRTQIGDYNNALEDYNKVVFYSPDNVLVYYNRAGLYTQLGDYEAAIADYTRAIELYPDFANAYLNRSSLRYMLRDREGSINDKRIAEQKIAEYRSKLNDSSFSIYADTSRQFNQLLSFETESSQERTRKITSRNADISLLPLFKFSLVAHDTLPEQPPHTPTGYFRYYSAEADSFEKSVNLPYMKWTNSPSDMPPDSLAAINTALSDSLRQGDESWQIYFKRGVVLSLIRQYTSSIASYTTAIDHDPTNPFLYINRSTTQSEMIDFVSSLDNGQQRITIDNDPVNRLKNQSNRVYNYDDAIGDLNRAIKLLPDFAYAYYNRANLYCLSGMLSEALEDYTHAIDLNPLFGEAYYNRGLIQIYLKDTHKGCLDMSKAGELGIKEAYKVLKIYGKTDY